jgi:hypothetical protein
VPPLELLWLPAWDSPLLLLLAPLLLAWSPAAPAEDDAGWFEEDGPVAEPDPLPGAALRDDAPLEEPVAWDVTTGADTFGAVTFGTATGTGSGSDGTVTVGVVRGGSLTGAGSGTVTGGGISERTPLEPAVASPERGPTASGTATPNAADATISTLRGRGTSDKACNILELSQFRGLNLPGIATKNYYPRIRAARQLPARSWERPRRRGLATGGSSGGCYTGAPKAD